MVWSSWLSAKGQSVLKKCFGFIGYHSHEHPWIYLSIAIIITALSGLGLTMYEFEGENAKLYTPTNSMIYKQRLRIIDYFGEFATNCFLLVGEKDGNNLLQSERINTLYNDIYFYITYNMSSESDEIIYDFIDLCERDYPGHPLCNSQQTSLFALFNENSNNWQTQSLIDLYVESDTGQELLSVCTL